MTSTSRNVVNASTVYAPPNAVAGVAPTAIVSAAVIASPVSAVPMATVERRGPGSETPSDEVDQVDDSYVAHDAQWWLETKLFPCRWKMAGAPSELARKAMSGELVEEENLRCEQVMARALGR